MYLQMKPDFKIKDYLYESADVIGKIYCEQCEIEYHEGLTMNGFATSDEIYAVYNEHV